MGASKSKWKYEVRAESLDDPAYFSGDYEVTELHHTPDQLVITLVSADESRQIDVTFRQVLGYRVLDEGDLLEFWPECSTPNGWLFQINFGGWLQQELDREGFLSGRNLLETKEFMITGISDCVNILSLDRPRIYKRQKA